MLSTPAGRPASAQISANINADNRVYVAGFNTTVLPMANAGATFHTNNIKGKFQGTMPPMTPTLCHSLISVSGTAAGGAWGVKERERRKRERERERRKKKASEPDSSRHQ